MKVKLLLNCKFKLIGFKITFHTSFSTYCTIGAEKNQDVNSDITIYSCVTKKKKNYIL